MKYILDFDRTILDTDSLKKIQADKFGLDVLGTLDSFEDINIEGLFFEDAVEFLQSHKKQDMCVVTSCTGITGICWPEFQKKKLELSNIKKYVDDVFVVPKQKDEVIRRISKGGPAIFVDDYVVYLDLVKEKVPGVETVHLLRDNILKSEEKSRYKHKEIKLLTELDAIIGL